MRFNGWDLGSVQGVVSWIQDQMTLLEKGSEQHQGIQESLAQLNFNLQWVRSWIQDQMTLLEKGSEQSHSCKIDCLIGPGRSVKLSPAQFQPKPTPASNSP